MLTVATIRGAMPRARAYKLGDGGGLFLYVAPTGLRSWRMAFRYHGKAKLLTFGSFPNVTLAQARDARDEARQQLRRGEDPSGARRRAREAAAAASAEQTFEEVARAWLELQRPRWSLVHAADVLVSLERDVFPRLGAMPVLAIDAPTVLETVRLVERRGSIETAKRIRQRISGIFQYAMSEGIAEANPAEVIRKALKPIVARGRQPALVDVDQAREVLRAAEAAAAPAGVKLASRLLALTAVRAAVVRGATWDEFEDVDWTGELVGPLRPLWRVPAARMKLSVARKADAAHDHLVPLSAEAVEVLRAARAIAGAGPFAFPATRGRRRPLAEGAIGALYAQAGFAGRHAPHGWRATFSTAMKARARRARRYEDLDTVELMLAHAVKDKVAAAYDRGAQLERRRELAQEWADLLMAGLAPATEILRPVEGPRPPNVPDAVAGRSRRPAARRSAPGAIRACDVASGMPPVAPALSGEHVPA